MPIDLSAARTARFTFSGKGGDYFRIWIVNLALTILTLGIYSAWAKVRRLKYFYRNTTLAGSSFDYHGDPKAILKGRIIAVILFALYKFSGSISPTLGLAAFSLLALVLPWLLVRSFKFKLHNTSYRGLRFSFRGTTRQGYKYFLLLPILALFTLYLLLPFAHQRIKRFQHGSSWFGNRQFGFSATPGEFYRLYLKLLGLLVLTILPIIVVIGSFHLSALLAPHGADPETKKQMAGLIFILIMAIYLLIFMLVGPWFAARLQNLVWNGTQLEQHQFVSDVKARKLFWIYLTNFIGIVLTIGLYKPFADIRLMRYRLERMGLITAGSLDDISADKEQEISATGQETADLFDFDISF